MDIEKLLEELKIALGEEDVQEETLVDEAPAEEAPELEPVEQAVLEPEAEPKEEPFKDSMSLADTFDAKAKIARALENLKSAIDEFKDATAEKVDLINDGNLLTEIEGLDRCVEGIETALAAGELLATELNDPFNAELPAAEELPEEELTIEDPNEHGLPNDEEEEEEEDYVRDFNLGAGFPIFKDEREDFEANKEDLLAQEKAEQEEQV